MIMTNHDGNDCIFNIIVDRLNNCYYDYDDDDDDDDYYYHYYYYFLFFIITII